MSGERIALVTTDPEYLGEEERDIALLVPALQRRGFEVSTPIWHDPTVDWAGFDLAVMRSPWDYPERVGEFMTWLEQTRILVRVCNPVELITWDIDKHYLADLAAAGIACAPFEFCYDLEETRAALRRCAGRQVIVKPTISVGSANTGWFAAEDPAAVELAGQILALGKVVMVQPAVEHVTRHGEHALIFFNGQFAASFHKAPILTFGGGYIGGRYTETITRGSPSPAEIALGEQTMAAIATIGADKGWPADACHPLYARIDVAMADGVSPQILEVEAFEPAYFADVIPEVADKFAAAVADLLARG